MYTFVAVLSTLLCVYPAVSQVLINEVLYDPDGTDTGKEKIEIRNAGSTSIDLTGYDLYPDGIGYFTFPTASLPPGAIAVVHLRQAGVNTGSDFFHPTPSSNLGNTSGGSVALFRSTTHNAGTMVSFVQWGAGGRGWASAAASAGVWSSVSDSVPVVSEGHSIEYDGSGFTSGDWFDQVAPTLGSPNALPVQLVSFAARRIGTTVFLSWETLTEVDNFGFEVERKVVSGFMLQGSSHETSSLNLEATWNRIGFVPGSGTSQVRRRYSFVDNAPFRGKAAYRLRQLDRDGAFTFSEVVEVEFTERSGSVNLDCYPNPFNPQTEVRYQMSEVRRVKLTVHDVLGREVVVLVDEVNGPGIYKVLWDASSMASGPYFVACDVEGRIIVRKLLLVR